MKSNENLIARAKKAARRASRSQGRPYQSCLDDVARASGREHWSAFLADPVDISPDDSPGIASTVPASTYPVEAMVEPDPLPEADAEAQHRTQRHPTGQRSRSGLAGRILRRLGIGEEPGLVREAVKRRIISRADPRSGYEGHPLLGASIGGSTVHMAELVPILAVAPPGTGKSAGIVIPAILTSEAISLVIHDECDLHVMTSGMRAQLGPVTVLHLGSEPSRGSLNPLAASWVPSEAAARSGYVNRLSEALSPENPIVAAVLSQAIIQSITDEGGTTFRAVAERLRRETVTPISHAALAALGPMLDPGVAECTTEDAFRPFDLRRGRSTDGGFEVGTLYVVRSREDGHRQARAAAVLQAAIWYHCLSHGPGERGFDGEQVGFRGILVVMDGAHLLPTMPMLATALDTGRSKKVGHMILGPSHGSIRRIFDPTMRDEFTSLVGLEIVLGQNSLLDAERIARRYPQLSVGRS